MSAARGVRRAIGRVLPERQKQALLRQERRLWASRPGALDALAKYYGTDKSTWSHSYTPLYARHLGPRRKAVRSVLEIGVGGTSSVSDYESLAGGQSLRMWCRYFPKATIVGVDIHPKAIAEARIRFEQGDQSDPKFLERLARTYGPFDVVIDDGSHIGRHTIATFEGLWPAVRPGGFYVIEDIGTSYHPFWEGGPPGTPETAVQLLKRQLDETVLHLEQGYRPSIAAMHVYSEIAFLQRVG